MAIRYGARSQGHIGQLHPQLQRVLYAFADQAPPSLDITVTDSFRGEAEQNAAFTSGKSKKPWPTSAHNRQPSWAFDFVNVGDGQKAYDPEEMAMRQGAIRLVAAKLNIKLKPLIQNGLLDLPHVELASE